jgi:hypothetical protein
MIEYLYDAIRAVAGQDFEVNAVVSNADGSLVSEGCVLVIHDGDRMIKAPGTYNAESGMWSFIVPSSSTVGMNGRYMYCIMRNNTNLCFKQPIYLV